MYKSFKIKNFRCFKELAITSFKRVNLIAGLNNVGKTALLEALFLHCGATNPDLTFKINAFRGIEKIKVEIGTWAEVGAWHWLFWHFDTSKEIELEGEDSWRRQSLLRIKLSRGGKILLDDFNTSKEIPLSSEISTQMLTFEFQRGISGRESYSMFIDQKGIRIEPSPPPLPFLAIFLAARTRIPPQEDAERYGELDALGQQERLLEVLKIIEPRLSRLSVVVSGGVPIIHGDIGLGRLVPLPIMGEGMARLCSLVLAIAKARKGVVLIDEIENGLHHSIIDKVWKAIAKAAEEFDTQIFATTHSLECIVAAHKAFEESDVYDFQLYRLERINDTINVISYDQEDLATAIEEGFEVR